MAKKHKKTKPAKQAAHDNKKGKLSRKYYEQELEKLQGELVKLQFWVRKTGAKVIIVFEGRDAAGKYIQRYLKHFPAAGEVVMFDRSWYNRAGVERVMGFCTDREYQRFMKLAPAFERVLADNDTLLIKYWFDVSMDEQQRRFQDRIDDERKQWKLSPMDTESFNRWYDYSRARDAMFEVTDTDDAPWHVVPSDDKKRARLNCISHLLSTIPYKELTRPKVKLGKRDLKGKYDDETPLKTRRIVPAKY